MRRSDLFHSFAPVNPLAGLAPERAEWPQRPQRPDRSPHSQPLNPREEAWLERRSTGASDWMDRWILKPSRG